MTQYIAISRDIWLTQLAKVADQAKRIRELEDTLRGIYVDCHIENVDMPVVFDIVEQMLGESEEEILDMAGLL